MNVSKELLKIARMIEGSDFYSRLYFNDGSEKVSGKTWNKNAAIQAAKLYMRQKDDLEKIEVIERDGMTEKVVKTFK